MLNNNHKIHKEQFSPSPMARRQSRIAATLVWLRLRSVARLLFAQALILSSCGATQKEPSRNSAKNKSFTHRDARFRWSFFPSRFVNGARHLVFERCVGRREWFLRGEKKTWKAESINLWFEGSSGAHSRRLLVSFMKSTSTAFEIKETRKICINFMNERRVVAVSLWLDAAFHQSSLQRADNSHRTTHHPPKALSSETSDVRMPSATLPLENGKIFTSKSWKSVKSFRCTNSSKILEVCAESVVNLGLALVTNCWQGWLGWRCGEGSRRGGRHVDEKLQWKFLARTFFAFFIRKICTPKIRSLRAGNWIFPPSEMFSSRLTSPRNAIKLNPMRIMQSQLSPAETSCEKLFCVFFSTSTSFVAFFFHEKW